MSRRVAHFTQAKRSTQYDAMFEICQITKAATKSEAGKAAQGINKHFLSIDLKPRKIQSNSENLLAVLDQGINVAHL